MTKAGSNMVDSLKSDQERPIFAADVSCPRCEYNLRGLVEPRCPECGAVFDPERLLAEHREQRKAAPSARWVAWNMLRHGVGFWRLWQVRYRQGPSMWQDLMVIMLAAMLYGAVLASVKMPSGGQLQRVVVLLCATKTAGIFLVLASVHGVLCWLGLKAITGDRGDAGKSDAIVGYSLWWLVPTAPLLVLVQVLQEVHRRVPLRPWEFPIGFWLLEGALVACCLYWMAVSYCGAQRVTRGSRPAALWCALCNPFPWLAVAALAEWRPVQRILGVGYLWGIS